MTVANGLLAASEAWHGRLPELFSGLDRADVETPIPFPTSCSPQAWAAATPFLLLRIMLGLEPDDAAGLKVDPIPGAIEDDLLLVGVRLVDRRFNVRIDDGVVAVRELRTTRLPLSPTARAAQRSVRRIDAADSVEAPPPRRARNWPWSVARRKLAQRRRS